MGKIQKVKQSRHILSDEELIDLAERCFVFCKEASGVELYPYQEEFGRRMCQSVLREDGEEITALFARQSGKTETVSCVTVGLCVILPTLARMEGLKEDDRINKFKDGLWVGIFAPSYELAGIMHSRMAQRMQSDSMLRVLNDPEVGIDLQGGRKVLRLPNGSYVDANSAGPQANIEGKTYHLIICEETQDISNYKIRKSIHPMGASTNASMVKIGTPNQHKNEFFDACERNRTKTNSGSVKLPCHFQYDYEYPSRHNPRYRQYIEREIDRLGYDSDEFRMSYRLHWLLERGHFIAPEIFDSCGIKKKSKIRNKIKGKYVHFVRSHVPYNSDSYTDNMVASLDVGRSNDSTVLTIGKVWWENPIHVSGEDRHYIHIVNWLEIEGDDHETQYPQILRYLSNYKIGSLIVDATGRGDPIYDRLYADLYDDGIEVLPFIFNQRSKHEGYMTLYQEIREQRLTYPAGDHARSMKKWQRFVRQMYDLQKNWKGKYLDVHAPKSKKRSSTGTDVHDDYADGLMMLCYLVNKKNIGVETMSNPFMGSSVKDSRQRFSAQIRESRGRRKFDGW